MIEFDQGVMDRLKCDYHLLHLFFAFIANQVKVGEPIQVAGRLLIDERGELLTEMKFAAASRPASVQLLHFEPAMKELKELEAHLLSDRYGLIELSSLDEMAGEIVGGMGLLLAVCEHNDGLIMNFDSELGDPFPTFEGTAPGVAASLSH